MSGRWIALAGFMGAGKSSVGRRVAARLDVPFVDSDREIEEGAGLTIPEIFDSRGELWFRRTEEAVIREIVARNPAGVVALGGGALESAKTRDVLSRLAHVVWLRVTPDVAWGRVQGSDRPLARDRGRFDRRAAAREATYRDAADLMVDADEPPDEVAGRVTAWAVARGRQETP
ncbi:MAG: shikimate kinase [Actinomycetota bacterium]